MSASDSEQRILELELALAEQTQRAEFLDALLQCVHVSVTAVDPNRRQLFVNRAFSKMVGWEPDELVGKDPPFAYWAPELGERIKGTLAEIIAQGKSEFSADWVFQRKSGERFDVSVATARLVDARGNQLGWCASMYDISERERLRDALVASLETRRALLAAVEGAGEAIFLTDSDGVFTYVNPRFTELYGWKPDEIVGKATPRVLKSGLLTPAEYEAFWSGLLSGQVVRGRITNRTRDGRLVRVESSSNSVSSAAGVLSGFLAIQMDVTEAEQLSAQLLQAQRMEAIARLASGVAHDFNNLLSVILAYTGFVLERLPEGATVREDVEEVRRAGERATALTRQLLLLSRHDTQSPEILDVGELVATTAKILRRTIGEDIDLCVETEGESPVIRAEIGSLTQVLMNLAINARDAMPNGGRLEIKTSTRALTASSADPLGLEPGTYVALEVADNGMGMPPEVLARAFEPYFTTKPTGKGTGLGLAIVLRVVRDLRGSLSVASEPGKGTKFCLLFPATTETPVRPSVPPPPIGAGKRILVLEDDDAVRTMIRRILSATGYNVLEARNGGEALLICERDGTDIDLLLSDIVMPHVSGPEIAARLQRLKPAMKVVFMSGYPDSANPAELEASGAAFLQKPFSRAELIAKLSEAGRMTQVGQ